MTPRSTLSLLVLLLLISFSHAIETGKQSALNGTCPGSTTICPRDRTCCNGTCCPEEFPLCHKSGRCIDDIGQTRCPKLPLDNGNGFVRGTLCTSDTSSCCTGRYPFCSIGDPVYCINSRGFVRCLDESTGNLSPGVVCADGICCPNPQRCCSTGNGKFRCCSKEEGGTGRPLEQADIARGVPGPTPVTMRPSPSSTGPVVQSPRPSVNVTPIPDATEPDDPTTGGATPTPEATSTPEASASPAAGTPGTSVVGGPEPDGNGLDPSPGEMDGSMTPTAENGDDGDGNGDDDDPVCLPGSAIIEVLGRGMLRVDEVETGDVVRVGGGEFSRVFMWTHRDGEFAGRRYVRVEAEGGVVLTVTEGHVVYVCKGMERGCAKEAVVVDEVERGDGVWRIGKEEEVELVRVLAVRRRVFERGLYNPQTEHGDVVVDGVVVSCYTRFVEMRAAHALLAPLRAMFGAGLSVVEEI